MDKFELEKVMHERGDTTADVAAALGISVTSFYNKKNESGTEFTQGEIKKMADRWELSANQLQSIFFS